MWEIRFSPPGEGLGRLGVWCPRNGLGTFLRVVLREMGRVCLLRWGRELGGGEPQDLPWQTWVVCEEGVLEEDQGVRGVRSGRSPGALRLPGWGSPTSLGCSQAPLGVTCVSPSGCPWTPGAEGREGGACGAGTRKSLWSLSRGLWEGGKEAGC